ncbi:porin [Aliiglaciecola sp. LCG003]|uniref:porin n=1 Tax=Aliiglaciecola sp. LCG003 TaxID=3053655 RepID=UPI002572B9E2|nr:porin [Aliiglaciecola sp. LCG003]WJG08799.1 porin [Aliiglaciecola sp. LCG003]
MKRILTLTTLACALTFSASAEVRINGFANMVGGITSSEDSLYGYDDSFSFSEESLFAIQVSGDINDKMTATGQLVAKGVNNYKAEFEWAYISYQATENLSISAGRLRLPLFRYSASKDVGYSYHWVTAPRAVYDVSFNNIEGLRFDYSTYSGDWEYNFQLSTGTINSDITVPDGTGGEEDEKLEAKNIVVVTAEAGYEWFKIRAVAGRGSTTFNLSVLEPTFTQLAAFSPSIVDSLRLQDDTAQFLGLGVEIDQFDWFISAEITEVNIKDSFLPKDTAYYVTAGIRTGKFTPSITYESLDGRGEIRFLDQVAALPAELQPTFTAAVTGVQQNFFDEYSVITLGLRYDMDTNVALKADISKYSDDVDDTADATLMRVAVNYVF